MSATTPLQKSAVSASQSEPNYPSLNRKEYTYSSYAYKTKIESITAEQIEMIAINVIAPVLAKLDVGMTDFYGINFKQKQCDQNSPFMKAALSLFVKQIQESFAMGESFAENGIKFEMFNSKSPGILNQMVSMLSKSDKDLIEQAIQTHLKEAKELTVTLGISRIHSPQNLCFVFEMNIDGIEEYGAATGFEGLTNEIKWDGLRFGDYVFTREEGQPLTVNIYKTS